MDGFFIRGPLKNFLPFFFLKASEVAVRAGTLKFILLVGLGRLEAIIDLDLSWITEVEE